MNLRVRTVFSSRFPALMAAFALRAVLLRLGLMALFLFPVTGYRLQLTNEVIAPDGLNRR